MGVQGAWAQQCRGHKRLETTRVPGNLEAAR